MYIRSKTLKLYNRDTRQNVHDIKIIQNVSGKRRVNFVYDPGNIYINIYITFYIKQ